MNAGFVMALVASALIGLLAIHCVSWRPTGLSRYPLLTIFLGLGLGLGLSSSMFFVWLSVLDAPRTAFPLAELALLVLLAGITLYVRKKRRPAIVAGSEKPTVAPTNHPILSLTLWVSVGCTTIAFLVRSATNRHGEWDAWMTWNMHARAIFRGGDHWRDVLMGLPGWSHPDYPLLVPAGVARIWTYVDGETALGPVSVAMVFAVATVGILYSSLSLLRSRTQGALAAVLLLGTLFFVVQAASQYADVPLSFFFLATFVLLCLGELWPEDSPRLLLLAGLTAGLSAWTKNEGLMFLLAVMVARGLVVVRSRGWGAWRGEARPFAVGLAPVLVMIGYFKARLAPPNDLMSTQGFRETADRLLDVPRYLEVLASVRRELFHFGDNGLVGLGWFLLTYLICAGPSGTAATSLGAKTAAITLALMLAGYTAVLLTVPAPLLATNLRSLERLLLQLWPSAVFAYFLLVRTPPEAGDASERMSHA
jgi:hypothetical protein